MDFLLLLLGIALLLVICAAQGLLRANIPRPIPCSIQREDTQEHPPLRCSRRPQSISVRECETLMRHFQGMLFITVSERGERRPLPFYGTYSLVMTPGQIVKELRWFPSKSCVVLCGDPKVCASVFGMLEYDPKTPMYILRDFSKRSEVA